MRYYVTIGERTFEVTLDEQGVEVDGVRAAADLRAVPGTPMHHLLLDGASHLLHAENGGAGEWLLYAHGARYEAQVMDERTRSIRTLAASSVTAGIAAVCASVPVAAAPSDAEPLRIELAAPASCPAHPTLAERIRSHTPRVREASAAESSRALRVGVTSEGDRFVADLRLIEDEEALERRVPGRTCEEVLAAIALITALAIDPLASAVPSDGGMSSQEEGARRAPDSTALRPTTPEPDAGGPPPKPVRLHARARVGVSLDLHGMGELVLGRSVWVEGALATRLAPALRIRLARTQSFTEDQNERSAYFHLTTVALETCFTAARSRATLELRPCAGLAGGVLEGASAAFGVQRMPRPWASLGAMLQGRWAIHGPLELEAALGLGLPLVRDNFFFLPRDDVYRAPGVVLLGNVGVGTTFW